MNNFEKLQSIIDEAEQLMRSNVRSFSPEFQAWHSRTQRLLINMFGQDSFEIKDFDKFHFSYRNFYTSEQDQIEKCRKDLQAVVSILKSYLDDIPNDMNSSSPERKELTYESCKKAFIVHGHDDGLKESVARLLEKQGIIAIILHEQPNQGRTIIEKFENYSDVGAAICLFTADDEGKAKEEKVLNSRARQNVVFEAGFFMGKMGRERTIILTERGVELPSDMQGIVYTDSRNWQVDVLNELDAMGYEIDFNVLKRKQ